MLRIKIMDGIPCIILDDGIIWSEEELKKESKNLIIPNYYTDVQQSKENSYYRKGLEELKKKFRENEK
ncbi:MAG: hypothetical protein ACFFA0_03050 [Promethearchaeota archaeon]